MPFLLQDNQRLWIMQSKPYKCTIQVNDILTMELAAGRGRAHKEAKLVPDRDQTSNSKSIILSGLLKQIE